MSPKVNVNPETADAPAAPTGTWDAIIQKAELRARDADAPFNPGDEEVNWTLRWDDNNLPQGVENSVFFYSTNVEAYKASEFVRTVRELGFDPEDFDPDEVSDIVVSVRGTQKLTKDKRPFFRVQQVFKRA